MARRMRSALGILIIAASCLLLTHCGGGSSPDPVVAPNTWDTMLWDNALWG